MASKSGSPKATPVPVNPKPFARSNLARRKAIPGIMYPHAAVGGYAPGQMPQAYGMPVGIAAVPRTIAILELGGAYYPNDTKLFCQDAGIPLANVQTTLLSGADNSSSDADGEVALDVQKAAEWWSYMTGLAANIRIVWGANTGTAFADIVNWCVQNIPDLGAISISWGQDESDWTTGDRQGMDSACQACKAVVSSASGDNDSGDGQTVPTTDYPACSPYVVGCGGTNFPLGGQETVWNNGNGEGTGGGFSRFYPIPSWQTPNTQGTGRMVPDLAMNADPNTGHLVYINGQKQVIGGTSAVAPMFSGFAGVVNGARLKANQPVLGNNILAQLWANPACFFDIVNGNNGQYNATTGPDPCTGLGRPLATLLSALVTGSVTPPTPPGGPTPPVSGPTLVQASQAVSAGTMDYARRLPPYFTKLVMGSVPFVDKRLSPLWSTTPASASPALTMPDLGSVLGYLEQIGLKYGEAALQQILQDILAGKAPVFTKP